MRREIYLNLILILLFTFFPCKFASLQACLACKEGAGGVARGYRPFFVLRAQLFTLRTRDWATVIVGRQFRHLHLAFNRASHAPWAYYRTVLRSVVG